MGRLNLVLVAGFGLLIWQWDNVVAFVNLMRGPSCEVWDCGARLFG